VVAGDHLAAPATLAACDGRSMLTEPGERASDRLHVSDAWVARQEVEPGDWESKRGQV
jgi:hypothetical protein